MRRFGLGGSVRLSEIQFLRWEHVKEDCIELPDTKTGGRVVPLGLEARAVLSALPRENDNPWVIAGKLPGSHLTDLQRPWRRIRQRAELEDVRRHPGTGSRRWKCSLRGFARGSGWAGRLGCRRSSFAGAVLSRALFGRKSEKQETPRSAARARSRRRRAPDARAASSAQPPAMAVAVCSDVLIAVDRVEGELR